MKVSWKAVAAAVADALSYYRETATLSVESGAKYIYKKYYRAAERNVPSDSQSTLNSASESWNDKASQAVFHPDSRWDDRTLQVHRYNPHSKQNENVFLGKTDALRDKDKIISIKHKVRDAPTVSRVQIVVSATVSGFALYKMVTGWASRCSAVSQWKVMNPELGGTGPDSAVFYLNQPLEEGTAKALIIDIAVNLSAVLEDLAQPPLGLTRLFPGIYGCDVPTQNVQKTKLEMTKDYGSAGGIMSSVLCKAAKYAAGNLYHGQEVQKAQEMAQKWGGDLNYAREVLRNVMRDIGWELEA